MWQAAGNLGEFLQQSFHFRAGVLVACLGGGFDSGGEHAASFARARLARQKLAVHEIGRNIVRVLLEENLKVLVRSGGIAAIHAFDR